MDELTIQLFDAIEKHLDVTPREIKSKKRNNHIVEARMIFAAIQDGAKSYITLTEIASLMCKHHTSIIHYLNRHEAALGFDRSYSKYYNTIVNTVLGGDNKLKLLEQKRWHQQQINDINNKLKFIDND